MHQVKTMSDELTFEAKPNKSTQLTADEELLQTLGYKQEFKREFTAFEVFGTLHPYFLSIESFSL